MSRIVISYRWADSAHPTARIESALRKAFGADAVFRDVKNVRPGTEFREAFEQAVREAEVVLLIIGSRWLAVRDAAGMRRLDAPDDLVRAEVEVALEQRKRIIPVLVDGGVIPRPHELPESIRKLATYHAVEIRNDPDFDDGVRRLVEALRPRRPRHRGWAAAALVAVAAVGIAASARRLAEAVDAGAEPGGAPRAAYAPAVPSGAAALVSTTTPYDPRFLGVSVPLPAPTKAAGAGPVLDYTHYSLRLDPARKMALYTAANVDRTRVAPVSDDTRWYLDPRIPPGAQHGDELYAHNEWNRGTLVPKLAVAWGDPATAERAARCVRFFPNAAPRHRSFDAGPWATLERFILDSLDPSAARMSLFTGPVFRPDDARLRDGRIPRSFWRIAVVNDPADARRLRVYAYLVDQYTTDERGAPKYTIFSGGLDPRDVQVPVDSIEQLTPLRFDALKPYDTYGEP